MSIEYPGNVMPAPGFSRGAVTTDDELMYSMQGYTQKGVTLAGGQGVLKAGTVLTRAGDKKWYAKGVGANGAGAARGFLRQAVNTGSVVGTTQAPVQDWQGNIVIMGIVKLSVVSAANASAIVTALAAGTQTDGIYGRIDTVLDTFTF